MNSGRRNLVLAWTIVAATAALVVVPLVSLDRRATYPLRPQQPAPTTMSSSNDRMFEREYFGITRDHMILYTTPGFSLPPDLHRLRPPAQ